MERTLDIEDVTISQAREKFTKFPQELTCKDKVIKVTSNKHPVLALISWEFFENIMETLEILSDKELMTMLDRSVKESESGKAISWDEAKKELSK
jgi:PHD/YefM family antitoxin component YafN of YafNO toxin-antitoxin module